MGNYIPNDFNEKTLLANYLNDQVVDLSYDKMKRFYFIEMSYNKFAVEDLIDMLNDPLYSEMSAWMIVKEYKETYEEYIRKAKTDRAKVLFQTAIGTAINAEDFLRAKGGII